MPTGLNDLFESERGVACILLIVAVTVLAILKVVTGADWIAFCKWIAVSLVASKTVTTAIDQIVPKVATTSPTPDPTPSSEPRP